MALVTKLVSRNHELERLLAKLREGKNHGERISQAQLDLFLAELHKTSDEDLAAANKKLEEAATDNAGRPERTKPPRQPPVRRPPPAALRRVDNPIAVPASERPCPVCGAERTCIAHEITEVIDLIPAEVIVRATADVEIVTFDPALIVTASAAVGTIPPLQFPAVLQSVPFPPTHV